MNDDPHTVQELERDSPGFCRDLEDLFESLPIVNGDYIDAEIETLALQYEDEGR